MRLLIVGFIDNPATRKELKDRLGDSAQLWDVPGEFSTPPEEGDLLLILHMSQEEDRAVARPTAADSCPRDCILAWSCGSLVSFSGVYGSYVEWVLKYRERIKLLAVTTGAPSFVEVRVAAARAAAANLPVVFCAPAALLAERLAMASEDSEITSLREMVDFVESGREGRSEPVLTLLSALLPFGLLWEAAAKDDSSRLGDAKCLLQAAAMLQNLESANALEQAVNNQICARLLDGSPPCDEIREKADSALSTLNRLLKESRARWKCECESECGPPESLDRALEILADSKSLDQWNARLCALRDTLLAEV